MDYTALIDFLNENSVKYVLNVNTAELVSFKVGGGGKIAVFPKSCEMLTKILTFIKNEKFVILGNGTNCYFTENFYDGIIIVTSGINNIADDGDTLVAECGASATGLCRIALEKQLSGFEFANGIPGTIGGGVVMNASAFGISFSDVVQSSTVFDCIEGKEYVLDLAGHCFDVKKSIFRDSSLCLLKTEFKLKKGDFAEIKAKMDENIRKRRATQPLDMPSAGSTFIRPKNTYASLLIDKAGLKGYSVGGATVSLKHAGFIVNSGGATSTDVQKLIEYIKKVVYDKFSVNLSEEIIYLE